MRFLYHFHVVEWIQTKKLHNDAAFTRSDINQSIMQIL